MSAAIGLEGVSVERGKTRAVDGVTLSMERARWFGLIGANGSGKTSLLRAIAGRLPFAGGRCRLDDEDLTDLRAVRAARIGFSPTIEALPDALRTRDVLRLVVGDLDRAMENIGELHGALGLAPLIDKWIADCSAGMRQRVAIAAAFAGGHDIVILDEPFNWLDPVAAFDVRQVLHARVERGLTLVTALHDLATLTQSCDVGAVMAGGRFALTLSGEDLREAGTDLPAFERQMIDVLRSSCEGTPAARIALTV
jgi:ABC-type multidrug transport system ATPase subunit